MHTPDNRQTLLGINIPSHMSSVRPKRLAGDVRKIVSMPLGKRSSCRYPFFLFKRNHFSTKDWHCSYIVNVIKPLVICVVIHCKCFFVWFLARAQITHVDNTFSGLYFLILTLRLIKICVVLLWNQNLFCTIPLLDFLFPAGWMCCSCLFPIVAASSSWMKVSVTLNANQW